MPDGLGRDAAKRHMLMRHRGPGDFARSAAQRSSTALPRPVVALYDQRCTERGISIMANVQVTLSLPVLRRGSDPESGPTHLKLMLNERGGFPNSACVPGRAYSGAVPLRGRPSRGREAVN